MLRGDISYFILLWYVSRLEYNTHKKLVVRFYVIIGLVTIKKINNISHSNYYMGYADTIGVIRY